MAQQSLESHLDDLEVGIRLEVDFGTELQLEIDGVASRVRSQLVGMEGGKYLVVRTPGLGRLGGVDYKLYPGNRVIVRYVHEGSVFGFETAVIENIVSPYKLLFLSIPRVVSERNIRSSRRIETLLPAVLTAAGTTFEGKVTDISIAGCNYKTRADSEEGSSAASLEVDSDVDLLIKLPGESQDVAVKGKIKAVRKNGKNVEIGMALVELDDASRGQIEAYVELSD